MRAMSGILAVLMASAACAQPKPDDGTRVYDQVLKSCVWIVSNRGGGKAATGSGSLIDRRRQLVLTNYHVVGDIPQATVFFPSYRGDGAVAEKDYYRQRSSQLGIAGKVLATDRKRDLAIIQLQKVPDGAIALPLASQPVRPGQPVHSIGNPGDSGALWVYTPGRVRQTYQKTWRAKVESQELQFSARVVETDSATNPGDSGGPLVNDAGELVAVTEGASIEAKLLSTFVDVSEVKTFLGAPDSRSVAAHPSQAEKRRDPLTVRDSANFFSEDGRKSADAAIADIHHRYGFDVLVETFPTAPKADLDDLKAKSAGQRIEYYKKWADQRDKAEKVDGIVLIITKDPSTLYLHSDQNAGLGAKYQDVSNALRTAVLDKFKTRQFDDGLLDMLKILRERLQREKPNAP